MPPDSDVFRVPDEVLLIIASFLPLRTDLDCLAERISGFTRCSTVFSEKKKKTETSIKISRWKEQPSSGLRITGTLMQQGSC